MTTELKATLAGHQSGKEAAAMRAELDAIEFEKLEQYQRRYEEYVRVSRALQALAA